MCSNPRLYAKHGSNLNATPHLSRHIPMSQTNPKHGVKKYPRRSALQIIAKWCPERKCAMTRTWSQQFKAPVKFATFNHNDIAGKGKFRNTLNGIFTRHHFIVFDGIPKQHISFISKMVSLINFNSCFSMLNFNAMFISHLHTVFDGTPALPLLFFFLNDKINISLTFFFSPDW